MKHKHYIKIFYLTNEKKQIISFVRELTAVQLLLFLKIQFSYINFSKNVALFFITFKVLTY